jgi:capsular polysaccharide biosynthesis protein
VSEDTIRLAAVGRILRRRWRLLAVLTVVGALFGYGVSLVFPPRYTASASVLLPGQWEARELLTQVDIATSSSVVDRVAAELRWGGMDGPALRERVSAKAAEGNIVTLLGTAETPERAQQLSDTMAHQFVLYAMRITGGNPDATTAPEALKKQVQETNRRITELAGAANPGQSVESVQARTTLERLRTTLEDAMKKLAEADPANNKVNMVVMGPAARPTDQSPPTRLQLVVAGALVFFLLSVVGHLAAARMNRRLRTEPEITSALGASLLGTVDVPEEPGARPEDGGALAGVRRLLGTDTRWDVPPPRSSGDEAGRRVRYRRVCARLRDLLPGSRRLLVVVPEGDEIARRAAGQLVAEAANGPSPSASSGAYPLLRLVEVPVERPMVPDREAEAGALVVLSAGRWTAGQLHEIAEACTDAGHEVVGIVVAGPVRAKKAARSAASAPDKAARTVAVGSRTTGGPA